MTIEYGIMSSKWSVTADNKLTCYAYILIQLNVSASMVVLYSPEEVVKNDSWAFHPNLSARIDEIFGGTGKFKSYIESHVDEIRECSKTVRRIV